MSVNAEREQKTTWKERRKKQLFDDFVQVAIKLFGEKGFDQPSVDEIVAETGVAKGTFYLYFKSKSDIIQAVIDTGLSMLEEKVADSLATAPDEAPQALKKTADCVLSFFEEHHSMIAILMTGQSISNSQLPEEVRYELRKRYRTVTSGAYEKIIRKGMLQGYFREVDAHTCANAFSGMLAGLVYDAIDSGRPFTEIPNEALDYMIKGIIRHG